MKRCLSILFLFVITCMLFASVLPVSAESSFQASSPKVTASWQGVTSNGKYETQCIAFQGVSKAEGYQADIKLVNQKTHKSKTVRLNVKKWKKKNTFYCEYKKIPLKKNTYYRTTFSIKGYRTLKNGKKEFTKTLKFAQWKE